jgi:hypothetical protein
LDWVGALDRGIVKLVDDRVAGALGEGVDRVALALVAVLVGANVCGRTRPQVGDRFDLLLGNFIVLSIVCTISGDKMPEIRDKSNEKSPALRAQATANRPPAIATVA